MRVKRHINIEQMEKNGCSFSSSLSFISAYKLMKCRHWLWLACVVCQRKLDDDCNAKWVKVWLRRNLWICNSFAWFKKLKKWRLRFRRIQSIQDSQPSAAVFLVLHFIISLLSMENSWTELCKRGVKLDANLKKKAFMFLTFLSNAEKRWTKWVFLSKSVVFITKQTPTSCRRWERTREKKKKIVDRGKERKENKPQSVNATRPQW